MKSIEPEQETSNFYSHPLYPNIPAIFDWSFIYPSIFNLIHKHTYPTICYYTNGSSTYSSLTVFQRLLNSNMQRSLLFFSFAIMTGVATNNTKINTFPHFSSASLEYIYRNKLKGKYIFPKCQISLHKVCTILHSHQQHMTVPILHSFFNAEFCHSLEFLFLQQVRICVSLWFDLVFLLL